MHKLIVNEVSYDLAKELSMYAALGQYVDEEDLEEVLRIIEEYPDDFGHFEIEEEQV